MRELLDCAVVMPPGCAAQARDWVDTHRGQSTRLRLHVLDLAGWVDDAPDTQLLSRTHLALRRFDCCVLPVSTSSLSWTRTALASTEVALPVPLVVLAFDIAAPALLDLLSLGVADFVRSPVCLDELRARLVNVRRQAPQTPPGRMDGASWRRPGQRDARSDSRDMRAVRPGDAHVSFGDGDVHEPLRSYAASSGSPSCMTLDEAGILPVVGEPVMQDAGVVDEPFRQAKARMIDDFERAYLRHALSRYSGNVAQAARASSKHRRAFWALMRKHQIDAAAYREPVACPSMLTSPDAESTCMRRQPG